MEQKQIVWNERKKNWQGELLFGCLIGTSIWLTYLILKFLVLFIMLQGYYEGCVDGVFYPETLSVGEEMQMKDRWRGHCRELTEKQWNPPQDEKQYPQD